MNHIFFGIIENIDNDQFTVKVIPTPVSGVTVGVASKNTYGFDKVSKSVFFAEHLRVKCSGIVDNDKFNLISIDFA